MSVRENSENPTFHPCSEEILEMNCGNTRVRMENPESLGEKTAGMVWGCPVVKIEQETNILNKR